MGELSENVARMGLNADPPQVLNADTLQVNNEA